MPANPNLLRLAERLMQQVRSDTVELSPASGTVPVSHYCAPERLARERATLFRRHPIAVAAASELDAPGTCRRHDALGLPIVLVRDDAGTLHAEDLFAAEGIQEGFLSGANEALTLGRLEGSVHHFHATIDRLLDAERQAS